MRYTLRPTRSMRRRRAMNYAEARAEVIRYGQLLVEHRLIQATWGNVSLRVDDDHFLMSPSGVDYFRVKPEEVVLISVADGSYEKGLHPSSERRMHQTIYQNRPDIWAVIHTHSASCAVFAACHADLRSDELFYPCAPSMPRACDVPTSSTPRRLAPTCARRWPRADHRCQDIWPQGGRLLIQHGVAPLPHV